MSASPYALPSLQALVDPSHILFGSDYPFMPEPGVADNVAGLADYEKFGQQQQWMIERQKALAPFPPLQSAYIAIKILFTKFPLPTHPSTLFVTTRLQG